MTVVLRHSKALNLSFVECSGGVDTAQLAALARCAGQHRDALVSDSLNVVRADSDFSGVDLGALAALYAHYRTLFAPVRLEVYRRTAWVCQCPAAEPYVDFWVRGAESKQAFKSNARRLPTLAEACDWLLLTPGEGQAIERGEGFVEIARFEPAATPAPAR